MQDLKFDFPDGEAATVLFLGAHSDDIEIGAGGTALRLAEDYPQLEFHWVTFSAEGARADEARASFRHFMGDADGRELELHAFRDGFFPYDGSQLKAAFEALKARIQPRLIFTHYRGDAHQDHRLVSELTWNTFRNHLILEYEIPKYDGDLGRPNVYLPLTAGQLEGKVAGILQSFATQQARRWFTAETFTSLARLRGIECNAPAGYAEAFHGPKLRF